VCVCVCVCVHVSAMVLTSDESGIRGTVLVLDSNGLMCESEICGAKVYQLLLHRYKIYLSVTTM
jgi:hypothetical protein